MKLPANLVAKNFEEIWPLLSRDASKKLLEQVLKLADGQAGQELEVDVELTQTRADARNEKFEPAIQQADQTSATISRKEVCELYAKSQLAVHKLLSALNPIKGYFPYRYWLSEVEKLVAEKGWTKIDPLLSQEEMANIADKLKKVAAEGGGWTIQEIAEAYGKNPDAVRAHSGKLEKIGERPNGTGKGRFRYVFSKESVEQLTTNLNWTRSK